MAQGDASTVDVSIDDITFDRWTGAGTTNDAGDRRMPQRGHIGLYAHESETVFHLVNLKMLTGRATPDADARKLAASAGNPARDVTRGLVAYWKFDEGQGTVARDSAGANDGEIQGGAKWAKVIRGGALSFDGVDDFVRVPNDPSINFAGDISLAAWVKIKALPPAGNGYERGIGNILAHGELHEQR